MKLSKKLALLAFTSTLAIANVAKAETIEFWSHTYGDQIAWKGAYADLIKEFEAGSEHKVNFEILPWNSSRKTWLTIAQGGAHPDCADMWWLHSFSAIGGDKYGPMPINDYKDKFNLDEFYPGALQDSNWNGDFYGVPWRGDIRLMLLRSDAMEEAGITSAPQNWDEVVDVAKKLTIRNGDNVERWGLGFGTIARPVDWMMPLYWQAGGEFMTDDGKTATIDNDAMRAALKYMHDLVNVHKVADPDAFEKGYKPQPLFVAGKIGMIASAEQGWGNKLEIENPEIDGKWEFARSAKGAQDRDSFSGAGYLGVLRGSDKVEACTDFLAFLAKDSSMLALSTASGKVATKPVVMASEFWTDSTYKLAVADALQDAHTSQHPAPAWSAISTSEPGGILYNLVYSTVIEQKDIGEAIATAEKLMQAELNRT